MGVNLAEALFLINADPKRVKLIQNKIKNWKVIQKLELLEGLYNIMAIVETEDMRDIRYSIRWKLLEIEGIGELDVCLFVEYGSCEAALPPTG